MDLFPFTPRDEQKRLLKDAREAVQQGRCMLAHAPTGIGKTAAVLAPALEYALAENKTVFFLTPRHSQHQIVIDTLTRIKERFKVEFLSVDFIGKRWMCPVPGVKDLNSGEFKDFCESVRKSESCTYYNNTVKDGQLTSKAKDVMGKITAGGPKHCEECIKLCGEFCPYEILMAAAKGAQVVVCDYFHLFNTGVRKSFLARTNKSLEDAILIIDEGHNLPNRLRDLNSSRLSEYAVMGAIKEVGKFSPDLEHDLKGILAALQKLNTKGVKEREISDKDFINPVEENCQSGYLDLQDALLHIGEEIRREQKRSFCGALGEFMETWAKQGDGYFRMVEVLPRNPPIAVVRKRCLDPAVSSEEVIKGAHSCIMMSGTLLPLNMYADLLGFPEDTMLNQYMSPFPKENRMDIIIPTVTTKYALRGDYEFNKIAKLVSKILLATPGNLAVFFPSYELMGSISQKVDTSKTILEEQQGLTKSEKSEILHRLRMLSGSGAVLYGVMGGSFAEGIDYPGDMLAGVVVVGLPLERPTLEVEQLIAYYQKKFNKGWEYAYTFPAVNKALQAAGRCFRSAQDRGIAVYMDKRYLWENYRRCFPANLNLVVSPDPHPLIQKFWSPGA